MKPKQTGRMVCVVKRVGRRLINRHRPGICRWIGHLSSVNTLCGRLHGVSHLKSFSMENEIRRYADVAGVRGRNGKSRISETQTSDHLLRSNAATIPAMRKLPLDPLWLNKTFKIESVTD